MDEMREKMNSAEFKAQIAEATWNATHAAIDSPEFKRQMEEVDRQVNSPEFRAQIEQSKKLAMEARDDAVQRSAERRKELEDARAAIVEARKQVKDEAVQRRLEEAQRHLVQASKTF